MSQIYLDRIRVFQEVAEASKSLPVIPTEKWTDAMVSRSNFKMIPPVKYPFSNPRVLDKDCIELAFLVQEAKGNPVILKILPLGQNR